VTIAILVSGAILGISAVLVVLRMTLGPTMLDRAISFDVLAAVLLAGIALDVAADRDADAVPILLVLTLLGFVGSVSIARFFPGSDDVDEPRLDEDPAGDEQASSDRADDGTFGRPTGGGLL
jgi:multicomponent Na+:H+ antiporter subunit F